MGNTRQSTYTAVSLTAMFVLTLISSTSRAQAAIDTYAAINISTPDQAGYSLIWPEGEGTVSIERSEDGTSFTRIAETEHNYYLDFPADTEIDYTYRVNGQIISSASQATGLPTITDVTLTPGASTEDEATLIVSFTTDSLAKARVRYGETSNYGTTTELTDGLNQSHTVLISQLKPGQTYHVQVEAQDASGTQTAAGDDQTVTTNAAPNQSNIFEIIIQALQDAFAWFGSWVTN